MWPDWGERQKRLISGVCAEKKKRKHRNDRPDQERLVNKWISTLKHTTLVHTHTHTHTHTLSWCKVCVVISWQLRAGERPINNLDSAVNVDHWLSTSTQKHPGLSPSLPPSLSLPLSRPLSVPGSVSLSPWLSLLITYTYPCYVTILHGSLARYTNKSVEYQPESSSGPVFSMFLALFLRFYCRLITFIEKTRELKRGQWLQQL